MSHNFHLNGKKILITGASSGIGKSTAIMAADLGADLIITGRDPEKLNMTLSMLKEGDHQVLIADLTKADDIEQIVSKTKQLDGIVHSAGATDYMPAHFINEKNIDQLANINYKAPVILTSRLIRKKKLNQNGAVVFISSIATEHP